MTRLRHPHRQEPTMYRLIVSAFRLAARAAVAVGLIATAAAARPAVAKVVFTGYGDFRMTPHSSFKLGLPKGAFPPTVSPGRFESRGATFDAIGLFATSSVGESA